MSSTDGAIHAPVVRENHPHPYRSKMTPTDLVGKEGRTVVGTGPRDGYDVRSTNGWSGFSGRVNGSSGPRSATGRGVRHGVLHRRSRVYKVGRGVGVGVTGVVGPVHHGTRTDGEGRGAGWGCVDVPSLRGRRSVSVHPSDRPSLHPLRSTPYGRHGSGDRRGRRAL